MYERIQDLVGVNGPAESAAETVTQSTPETTPENTGTPHPREALDNVKRATIVALVRLGGSRRMAAREVGCNPATITRTAGRDPQFAERLAHAESLADHKALDVISRAQDQEKYWRAAAWVLERRNPDEFARRTPHTFTAEQVMEVIARLIRVLLPAVPHDRRDEVMLEFNDTLAELGPLVAKTADDRATTAGPNGSQNKLYTDEENLSLAQVEEIRRRHWERSERWIRELSDIEVHNAWTMSLHRLSVERGGDLSGDDPWSDRLRYEWFKRCQNRPVTYPGGIELPSSIPFAEAVVIAAKLRTEKEASEAQHSPAQQPVAQRTTKLGG